MRNLIVLSLLFSTHAALARPRIPNHFSCRFDDGMTAELSVTSESMPSSKNGHGIITGKGESRDFPHLWFVVGSDNTIRVSRPLQSKPALVVTVFPFKPLTDGRFEAKLQPNVPGTCVYY